MLKKSKRKINKSNNKMKIAVADTGYVGLSFDGFFKKGLTKDRKMKTLLIIQHLLKLHIRHEAPCPTISLPREAARRSLLAMSIALYIAHSL